MLWDPDEIPKDLHEWVMFKRYLICGDVTCAEWRTAALFSSDRLRISHSSEPASYTSVDKSDMKSWVQINWTLRTHRSFNFRSDSSLERHLTNLPMKMLKGKTGWLLPVLNLQQHMPFYCHGNWASICVIGKNVLLQFWWYSLAQRENAAAIQKLKGEKKAVTLDWAQIGLFCEKKIVKTCLFILPSTCFVVPRNKPSKLYKNVDTVEATAAYTWPLCFKDMKEKKVTSEE